MDIWSTMEDPSPVKKAPEPPKKEEVGAAETAALGEDKMEVDDDDTKKDSTITNANEAASAAQGVESSDAGMSMEVDTPAAETKIPASDNGGNPPAAKGDNGETTPGQPATDAAAGEEGEQPAAAEEKDPGAKAEDGKGGSAEQPAADTAATGDKSDTPAIPAEDAKPEANSEPVAAEASEEKVDAEKEEKSDKMETEEKPSAEESASAADAAPGTSDVVPESAPIDAATEKTSGAESKTPDKMDVEEKPSAEEKDTAPESTPLAEKSGTADVVPESADATTKDVGEKTPDVENKTADVVPESEAPVSSKPKYEVGTIVFKLFFDAWYFGHVVSVDAEENIYKVCYEDGDREELEEAEMEPTVVRLNGEVALTSTTPPPLEDTEPPEGGWNPVNLGLTGTAAIVLHNNLYKHLDRPSLVGYIKRRKEEQASKDLESQGKAGGAKSPKRFKRTANKQKPKGRTKPTLKKPVLKKPVLKKPSPKKISPKVVAKPKKSPKPAPPPKVKKPPTPKAKAEPAKPFPTYPLGTVVYKYFGPQWFFGFVGKLDAKARLYGVMYEDGDKEELNEREMELLVVKLADGNPAKTAVTPDISDETWKSDEAIDVISPGTIDVCSKEQYKNLDKEFVQEYIEKRHRLLVEETETRRRQAEESAHKRKAFSSSLSASKRARTGSDHVVSSMRRSAFDPETGKLSERVCDFFRFVYERQMMWVRRNKDDYLPSKEPEEGESTLVLTHDPVLRSYSFCNVYRELDRGTAFFHGHILNLRETKESWTDQEWLETVLWAAYVYRLVNRIETFVELGIPTLDKVDDYKKRANDYAGKKDVQFFTGAHQTLPLGTYFNNLRTLSRSDGKLLRDKASELLNAKSTEECLEILMTIDGVANFISWQLFCDLQESGCLKQCARDSYCNLGPGARKGVDIIFHGSDPDHRAEALALVQVQNRAFTQIGVEFPRWQGRRLTVKEIEHALCEFSKYMALKTGKFGRVRWFKSKGEMDGDKPCHTCKVVKDEGALCDTCIEFYCSECVPPPPMELESWLCPRCTKMEATFRVKEEGTEEDEPTWEQMNVDISAKEEAGVKKEEATEIIPPSTESAKMDVEKSDSAKDAETKPASESTDMDVEKHNTVEDAETKPVSAEESKETDTSDNKGSVEKQEGEKGSAEMDVEAKPDTAEQASAEEPAEENPETKPNADGMPSAEKQEEKDTETKPAAAEQVESISESGEKPVNADEKASEEKEVTKDAEAKPESIESEIQPIDAMHAVSTPETTAAQAPAVGKDEDTNGAAAKSQTAGELNPKTETDASPPAETAPPVQESS